MRGEGWECTNCGNKEVIPAPEGYMSHKNCPNGWFLMVGPTINDRSYTNPVRYHSNTEHHFCSWKCVEDYAYTQRQQNGN